MNRGDWVLAAVAVVSVVASLAHGLAHATIPVEDPAWRLALALVVLFVAPALGVTLLGLGRRVAAQWTLSLAGGAGLVFEGVLHFVVVNPDHVSAVETGHILFLNTAILTTAGDALLLAVAAGLLWRQAQGSSRRSAIASTR